MSQQQNLRPVELPPVARARALATAIASASEAIEHTQRLPEPLLRALHQARLFRLLLPLSIGGEQSEPTAYLAAIEAYLGFRGTSSRIFTPGSKDLGHRHPGVGRRLAAKLLATRKIVSDAASQTRSH